MERTKVVKSSSTCLWGGWNHHPEASPGGQYYGEPDGWGQFSVSWLDERHILAKLDKEERENEAKMEKEESRQSALFADVRSRTSSPCILLESPEKLESTNSLQVSDTTDARLLVGLYRCTDLPGQFMWEAGLRTRAVTGRAWLLKRT